MLWVRVRVGRGHMGSWRGRTEGAGGGGFVYMLFFLRTPQKMKNKIAWFEDQNAYMFIHAKGKKMFSQNHVHV